MKKFILVAAIIVCGNTVWASAAQMFKLDNGQTVVIQEVKNNPIVTIDTWIKTGSIDEDDSNNGVAHFLEHLFSKVQKPMNRVSLIKSLKLKAQLLMPQQAKILLIIILQFHQKILTLQWNFTGI